MAVSALHHDTINGNVTPKDLSDVDRTNVEIANVQSANVQSANVQSECAVELVSRDESVESVSAPTVVSSSDSSDQKSNPADLAASDPLTSVSTSAATDSEVTPRLKIKVEPEDFFARLRARHAHLWNVPAGTSAG